MNEQVYEYTYLSPCSNNPSFMAEGSTFFTTTTAAARTSFHICETSVQVGRTMHPLKTCLAIKPLIGTGWKLSKFQVKYRSGEVIKCNLDDLKIDAPFILAMYLRPKKNFSPAIKEWSQRALVTLDKSLYRTRLIEPKTCLNPVETSTSTAWC